MPNQKPNTNVETITVNVDEHNKAKAQYDKYIKQANALYEQFTPEQKQLLGEEMSDVAAGIVSPTASQVIPNLITKTTQQIVKNTYLKFPWVSGFRYDTVANGNFYTEYSDVVEGSSILNNDIYKTADTGESTTPRRGFDDVEIADFNGKLNPVFEEIKAVDSEFSRKIKILSNVVNDFAFTPTQFMAITKMIELYLKNAIEIYNAQRALRFLLSTENHPNVTALQIEADSYPATSDAVVETKIKVVLTQLVNEVKKTLSNLNTPSRLHLKKVGGGTDLLPAGATQPLYYDGKNEGRRIIYIDSTLKARIDTFLLPNAFNEETLKLANAGNFVKVVSVDMSEASVISQYSGYLADSKSVASVYKTTGKDLQTPKVIIMDEGSFLDFSWYQASTLVSTPRMFSVSNFFMYRGFYRFKDMYSATFGFIEKTTP